MLLQAASHCMFIFIAVQDCVVWITSNFIYTFYCCWTFGLFPVFPVWVIWKGYSDHQVCEIPCGFLFFLRNIYLCGARKKKLLLFESSSGILLRDQELAWESEKPRAAVHALPRGSRLPDCLKMMGTFLPRDVWTQLLLSFIHHFASDIYGSNSRKLDLSNNSSCFEENESLLGMFLPSGQIERRQ